MGWKGTGNRKVHDTYRGRRAYVRCYTGALGMTMIESWRCTKEWFRVENSTASLASTIDDKNLKQCQHLSVADPLGKVD